MTSRTTVRKRFISHTPFLLLAVCALAVAAVGLTACGAQEEETAYETVEPGKLTAAVYLLGPPMEYLPHNTNKPNGFEVDLVKAMASHMDLEPEFKTYQSIDEVFQAVQNGEADLAASPEPIFDAQETVDSFPGVTLSDPYLPFTGSVVSMPGADDSVTAVEEPGTRISVQRETVDENWARQHFPRAELILCDSASDCSTALVTGEASYAIMDLPTALFLINNVFPNLVVIQTVDTTYEFRFGTREEAANLSRGVNDVLSTLKDSGYVTSLQVKWFGEELGFAE